MADPTAQDSLRLLEPPARALVDGFLASRQLPEDVGDDLIDAIGQVLSGLEKVSVKPAALCDAVAPAGAPATPSEMVKRLADYLGEQTSGKDPAKVRIVLEEE